MSDGAFIHVVRTDIDPENFVVAFHSGTKIAVDQDRLSIVEVSGNQMKLSDAGIAGGRAAVEIHTFSTATNVGPARHMETSRCPISI
jgi:polar amino acid transport system substrate-binding protein